MALELVVVTPEGEAFSEAVESVVLPGSEGEFGVLESHERFLTRLVHGPVAIKRTGGDTQWAGISDGFAEVDGRRVVVMVDECYHAHEIDLEEATRAREEAERELAALEMNLETGEQAARLESVVVRASVMIEVHGRSRG